MKTKVMYVLLKSKMILIIGLPILLFACNTKPRIDLEKLREDSIAKSNGYIPSSAAVEDKKDSTRKFIRTAEMRFRVKSVAKATYLIEDYTAKYKGFVTYTNLVSSIENKTIIPISADSSLESIYFIVSNSMTLRVPNTKLDSSLRTIATLIDYLDSRTIKADDVSLQILANKMTLKRVGKHEARLKTAIDNQGKKLNETTNAEENLVNKQEQLDNSIISNLSLNDQINYSSINLVIYQRQEIKRTKIANDKNIDAYETGFGTKLVESLKDGWSVLTAIFLFILKLWGLVLLGVGIYLIYKYFSNRPYTPKIPPEGEK